MNPLASKTGGGAESGQVGCPKSKSPVIRLGIRHVEKS